MSYAVRSGSRLLGRLRILFAIPGTQQVDIRLSGFYAVSVLDMYAYSVGSGALAVAAG